MINMVTICVIFVLSILLIGARIGVPIAKMSSVNGLKWRVHQFLVDVCESGAKVRSKHPTSECAAKWWLIAQSL